MRRNFYKLTKISDRRNPPKDLPQELPSSRLYGQYAYVSVPTDEAWELIESAQMIRDAGIEGEKAMELVQNKAKNLTDDGKFFRVQEELRPIRGRYLMFTSLKLSAGWFRTSLVEDYSVRPNGDVEIITLNSVYLAEKLQDDDNE